MAVFVTSDPPLPIRGWMRLADLPGECRLLALLLAAGLEYDDIAAALRVPRKTAQNRTYHLAQELGLPHDAAPRLALALWVWQQQPSGVTVRMRRKDSGGVR